VFVERRERVGVIIQKGTEVSRLSGAESIVGLHVKFELCALLKRKPMKLAVVLSGRSVVQITMRKKLKQ